MDTASRVVIGMDPHKRSVTIEVMTKDEPIVGTGRIPTDRDGHAAMRRYVQAWPDRVWAIEGCQGIGRHVANRLLAEGEQVVDVPPELSARARVFATGQGRKTDANRRALSGTGRHTDERPASCGRRRGPGGAADPGRPATVAGRGAHPQDVAGPPPAARADPRRREEGPVRRPSQEVARDGPPARCRRQDPAPGRGRTDHRPRADLSAQEGRKQGVSPPWSPPPAPPSWI